MKRNERGRKEMKIVLDPKKSFAQNKAGYFEAAKSARLKQGKILQTIARLQLSLNEEKAKPVQLQAASVRVKQSVEKEWFEKFHYFTTSGGQLVIAGKDAKQNDLLFSKYFDDNDLFLHADVHGAAATIIKNGVEASEQARKEAAQFALSYSSAWKAGLKAGDVFAVPKTQVSKYSHGEFVAKGAFMILGKKQWFRNLELKLVLTAGKGGKLFSFPSDYAGEFGEKKIVLTPGSDGKNAVAQEIKKRLGIINVDEMLSVIPGDSKIVL
ncbi:DUF814 domain-containing protein [Candidatus Micrarchaeota archaeon]|nr:DUF814 domain-containing protein [Candidatus Micrarchaeota archaeon]